MDSSQGHGNFKKLRNNRHPERKRNKITWLIMELLPGYKSENWLYKNNPIENKKKVNDDDDEF